MSDKYNSESMLDVFIFEISQMIEQLEELILSNEEECSYSENSLNEVFRIMHTIKGSSGMMSYFNISSLAHAMEDLFFYLREKKPNHVDCRALSDLILEGIDYIKIEIVKIKNGDQPDGDFSKLKDRIDDFLRCLKNGGEVKQKNHYKVTVFFEDGCEMENIRAYSIIRNVKELDEEPTYIPDNIESSDDAIDEIRKHGFIIHLATFSDYDSVYDFFLHTEFLRGFEIIESKGTVNSPTKSESLPDVKKMEASQSLQESIISVGVGKLDKLMDLMGELVIAEAMVTQNSDLRGLELDSFYKSARQLNKITAEMQNMVMSIRMVKLQATFHKMHRLVRDMSKQLNKEVTLKIIGEETELDKKIIEHISDPLMHLVRNAVDHGFECPEEREKLGKPREGTLTLEAKNTGGDVLILIKDDGKGLNKNQILEKANEKGLLVRNQEEMLDREIYNLIFLPGFSTKNDISEFSGRGVGMDVVMKSIEMVGGTVSMDSTENVGTTFTLKIPLTLAIIDGMNIKVGNSHYTIPTTSVKEFFKVEQKNIVTDPDNNEMIMVRGQCYPILRLHKYFKIKNTKTQYEEGIIILVEREDTMLCIFADELLGQQQVVVKTLPEYIRRFKTIKGISGCTLLGDGNISLILDVQGLIFE